MEGLGALAQGFGQTAAGPIAQAPVLGFQARERKAERQERQAERAEERAVRLAKEEREKEEFTLKKADFEERKKLLGFELRKAERIEQEEISPEGVAARKATTAATHFEAEEKIRLGKRKKDTEAEAALLKALEDAKARAALGVVGAEEDTAKAEAALKKHQVATLPDAALAQKATEAGLKAAPRLAEAQVATAEHGVASLPGAQLVRGAAEAEAAEAPALARAKTSSAVTDAARRALELASELPAAETVAYKRALMKTQKETAIAEAAIRTAEAKARSAQLERQGRIEAANAVLKEAEVANIESDRERMKEALRTMRAQRRTAEADAVIKDNQAASLLDPAVNRATALKIAEANGIRAEAEAILSKGEADAMVDPVERRELAVRLLRAKNRHVEAEALEAENRAAVSKDVADLSVKALAADLEGKNLSNNIHAIELAKTLKYDLGDPTKKAFMQEVLKTGLEIQAQIAQANISEGTMEDIISSFTEAALRLGKQFSPEEIDSDPEIQSILQEAMKGSLDGNMPRVDRILAGMDKAEVNSRIRKQQREDAAATRPDAIAAAPTNRLMKDIQQTAAALGIKGKPSELLKNEKIISFRSAQFGERFVTLAGVTRRLPDNNALGELKPIGDVVSDYLSNDLDQDDLEKDMPDYMASKNLATMDEAIKELHTDLVNQMASEPSMLRVARMEPDFVGSTSPATYAVKSYYSRIMNKLGKRSVWGRKD